MLRVCHCTVVTMHLCFLSVAEFERVKETLVLTQQELQNARCLTIAIVDQCLHEEHKLQYMCCSVPSELQCKCHLVGGPYRDTIAARDRSISERDANNTELQRQIEVITDRLKVHVCGNSLHLASMNRL